MRSVFDEGLQGSGLYEVSALRDQKCSCIKAEAEKPFDTWNESDGPQSVV